MMKTLGISILWFSLSAYVTPTIKVSLLGNWRIHRLLIRPNISYVTVEIPFNYCNIFNTLLPGQAKICVIDKPAL